MMRDFLWEIGCEEIPARMQIQAGEQLERLITQHAGAFHFDQMQSYCSPRRLAVRLQQVTAFQMPEEVKQGPLVGLGDKALAGFCRTWSVKSESCQQMDTAKGPVWCVTIPAKEIPIEGALIDMCTQVLQQFFWPKRMRWSNSVSWIRPVRWMLAILGDQVLNWTWNDVVAGSWSEAHRLAPNTVFFPEPLALSHQNMPTSRLGVNIISPESYVIQLGHSGVIVDHHLRQQRIGRDVERLAAEQGGVSYADAFESLVQENAGLTQWPMAILCDFDPQFLGLPLEVIVTTLQVHQKCFCIQSNTDGALLPHFIMIADGPLPQDHIKDGYQRVVDARLSDALFFWNQDLKTSLEIRTMDLKKRSFFQDLGTLYDKTQRLEKIIQWLVDHAGYSDWAELANQAVRVWKCDLLTAMVGEFPTLQGVMGRHYAIHQNLDPRVAWALQEAYLYSRQNLDQLESLGVLGAFLAIADGVDTLVGFFALGRIPSGSKDPMALRRACHGVIKALIAKNISIDLPDLVDLALRTYQGQGFLKESEAGVADRLVSFFQDRLGFLLTESKILTNQMAIKALMGYHNMLMAWGDGVKLGQISAEHPEFLMAYRRLHSLIRQMSDDDDSDDWSVLHHPLEKEIQDLLSQSCTIETLSIWAQKLNSFLDRIKVQEAPYTQARLGLLRCTNQHVTRLAPLDLLML